MLMMGMNWFYISYRFLNWSMFYMSYRLFNWFYMMMMLYSFNMIMFNRFNMSVFNNSWFLLNIRYRLYLFSWFKNFWMFNRSSFNIGWLNVRIIYIMSMNRLSLINFRVCNMNRFCFNNFFNRLINYCRMGDMAYSCWLNMRVMNI